MDYLQELNKKIAEAVAENKQRIQLVEKVSEEVTESNKVIRNTQEEYVAVERIIEGLIKAKELYIETTKENGN